MKNSVLTIKPALCFIFALCLTQWSYAAEVSGTVGDEFEIAATNLSEWMPTLEYNSVDDEFLVLWYASGIREQDGPVKYSFHGRRVSTAGALLGEQFSPVDYEDTDLGILPTPVFNPGKNEYMVAYHLARAATGVDILVNITDNLGAITFGPLALSEDPSNQIHPAIVFNSKKKEYFVAFNDSRYGESDIFGVILDESGTIIKPEFLVNSADGGQINPHACYNPTDDTYLVNWEDFRNVDDWQANSDIYGALLDGSGNVLVNDIPMRDDFGTNDEGDQRHNNIVYNPDKNEFIAVWSDNGRPSLQNGGAVGIVVNADGSLADSEIIICDKAGFQMFPHLVYVPGKQMYFAVWEDGRNNNDPDGLYWRDAENWDIYAAWLDPSGNAVGDEIAVCTKQGVQRYSKVSYASQSDKFLIAWQDVVEETGWGEGGEQHVTEEGGNIMGAVYEVAPDSDCPLALSIENENTLDMLRAFRDGYLKKSANRDLVRMYYESAGEISSILKKNPHMIQAVRKLVAENIFCIPRLLLTGRALPDSAAIGDISAFLNRLKTKGSNRLGKHIDILSTGLQNGSLFR